MNHIAAQRMDARGIRLEVRAQLESSWGVTMSKAIGQETTSYKLPTYSCDCYHCFLWICYFQPFTFILSFHISVVRRKEILFQGSQIASTKLPNTLEKNVFLKNNTWASLAAQWLRTRLPVQGTYVRALVWVDPTCRGATKPVHHNYWACTLEPVSHNYWAHTPQLLKPAHLEPRLRNKRSHCSEKTAHRNKE